MKQDVLQQYAATRQLLINERDRIQSRLAEIDRALGTTTVFTPIRSSRPNAGRRGPRNGNTMTMREAITKALKSRPMSTREIVEAIRRLGYSFRTKNPANSVGVFLYTHKNLFKNTAKGVFALT